MVAAIQHKQLRDLCSSSETLEKAQSILRLVLAKTRPGSGFAVTSTAAIPPICAYLASEQLNMGEVSLQSATCAACVTQAEFNDILRKVRAALATDAGNSSVVVTYETLVDAYRIHPREDAICCMEDTEAALPHVNVLEERYGANTVSCAVFYWVCQLMEEPSIQERALCHACSINPKSFKAVVKTLDKQCDSIADQIKSVLLQKRSCPPAPRATTTRKPSIPAMTPSKKRTVAFARLSSDGDVANADGRSFPETPTKKRRVDASPGKPRTSRSPAKRPSAASTAAFHAALQGSPTKLTIGQASDASVAGPSTPRRPRHARDVTATPVQATSQPSPSRSRGQTSPARPPVRRRFRPIFLEQQQWCARDPKIERMWAAADTTWRKTVALHGHPFQTSKRGGAVIGAA